MSETTATAEKVLTIQRSKWRRGGDDFTAERGRTRLLNHQGFMCCLGFDAIACGLTEAEILGKSDPEDLAWADDVRRQHEAYFQRRVSIDITGDELDEASNFEVVGRAIDHNDDDGLTDAQREQLIAEDLKALGWDRVEFVD